MSYTELLNSFSLIIGLGVSFIGLLAISAPRFMSKNFGIPLDDKKALSYIVSLGIRDIFIGLTVFYLFFEKAWMTIAFVHFFISIVALSDFIVVMKHGDKNSYITHLTGLVISLLYGVLMYKSHCG